MKRVLSISILIILSIVGCKKYDFEEIPDYHYLIVSDTYIPWWSGKYWINFSSDYEISYDYSNKYSTTDTFKLLQQKGVELSGSISTGGSSSVSHQCAARTKKGKRCKRRASKGSIYCWQHGG